MVLPSASAHPLYNISKQHLWPLFSSNLTYFIYNMNCLVAFCKSFLNKHHKFDTLTGGLL